MTSSPLTHRPSLSLAQLGWPAVISSARTAIAATASFLIARLFGLPEAYWAPISTIVVMQSTLGAAEISGDHFFIGTIMRLNARAFSVSCASLVGICSGDISPRHSLRSVQAPGFLPLRGHYPRHHHAHSPHRRPVDCSLHRFIEVSIGIVIGLAVTVIWPTTVASRGGKEPKTNGSRIERSSFRIRVGFERYRNPRAS